MSAPTRRSLRRLRAESTAPDALVPQAADIAPEAAHIAATVPSPTGVPSTADFEAALQALAAAPVRVERPASAAVRMLPVPPPSVVPVPRRIRRGSSFRRAAAFGASVGIMGLAGLLAVSMTLPAQAVAAVRGGSSSSMSLVVGTDTGQGKAAAGEGRIQAFVAPTDVQATALQGAQGFTAASQRDVAAERGIHFSSSLYTNDPTAKIQWPFIVGVAMSSPYGMRDGVMHQGIDLVPGEGAPIQAIADGVVRLATESDGGYGVGVYVDHIIDGKPITSHYAHMQYGSLRVKTGQPIKVGDIIGLTGNTGHSFGAHLHFELYVNGSTIDPLPWMQANTGRH
ncbi:M23 family metallopeptidase [Microbacterium capsulatum]|uniref:M23 family metallopeptidase n=1 Tax=Microbacterium capsulatum TaxID=3041921 RepID=A0ABU0XF70_9MICO|nr:M23 family metallopeptidase [Microbacterium sp. ASV81]MDQ4213758.1 M23 family metallopeptidase [Microbacterium sp. ASV81]